MNSPLLHHFTSATLYMNPNVTRGEPYDYAVQLFTANAITAQRLADQLRASFLALGIEGASVRIMASANNQSQSLFISGSKREIQTILSEVIGQNVPGSPAFRFFSIHDLTPIFR